MSNGHGSELAAVASFMRVDASGNLLNPDGSIHTNITRGSLKRIYASVQELIDDAARINFPNEIHVDGGTVQQGGQPPALFGSIADGPDAGKFQQYDGPTAPPITVPAVVPATVTGGQWAVRLDDIPPSRQVQFYTTGVGAGGTITLDVPAGPGRIRGTEKALTTVTTRRVTMWHDNKPVIVNMDYGTSIDVRMDATAGRYVIEITAPGYDGEYGPCDMSLIVDYDKN